MSQLCITPEDANILIKEYGYKVNTLIGCSIEEANSFLVFPRAKALLTSRFTSTDYVDLEDVLCLSILDVSLWDAYIEDMKLKKQ